MATLLERGDVMGRERPVTVATSQLLASIGELMDIGAPVRIKDEDAHLSEVSILNTGSRWRYDPSLRDPENDAAQSSG